MKWKDISSELIHIVLTHVDAGDTDYEISRKTGLGTRHLRRIRDENGRARSSRSAAYSNEQKNDAYELFYEGLTLAEVSQQTGIGVQTLRRWREEGIEEGMPLPELRKQVSRGKQKYTDDEILDLMFQNPGFGINRFIKRLAINPRTVFDIVDAWNESMEYDILAHLNEARPVNREDYIELFGIEPAGPPISIETQTLDDGQSIDVPLYDLPDSVELNWGQVSERNTHSGSGIQQWVDSIIELDGYISSRRHLQSFVNETGLGETKFPKWMRKAGLKFDVHSQHWLRPSV